MGCAYGIDPCHGIGKIASVDRFDYDDNGNMITRNKGQSDEQALTWDHENRLENVSDTGIDGNSISGSYLYDDSGMRIKQVSNGVDIDHPFPYYEVKDFALAELTLYYFFNGQPIALDDGSLTYPHGNHRGSIISTTDISNALDVEHQYNTYEEIVMVAHCPASITISACGGATCPHALSEQPASC